MEIYLKANLKKGWNESDGFEYKIHSYKPDEPVILPRASGNIDSYSITIKSIKKLINPKLIFNGVEFVDLSNDGSDPNVWQKKRLSAKEYFAFNLGIVSLDLECDGKITQLCTLINEDLEKRKKIEHMYERIFETDFIEFFRVFKRGNAPSMMREGGSDPYILLVFIVYEYLTALENLKTNNVPLLYKLRKSESSNSVSKNVENLDINYLLENPSYLLGTGSEGIQIGYRTFFLDRLTQSNIIYDYDTYENRLILSCLFSMRNEFEQYLQTNNKNNKKNFLDRTIKKFCERIESTINFFQSKFKIKKPSLETPSFMPKMITNPYYRNLFRLIHEWFGHVSVVFNSKGDLRTPIENVTKIFEYYCLMEIVKIFEESGYERMNIDFDEGEPVVLELLKGSSSVKIYYQMKVWKNREEQFIFTSKTHGLYYEPDIVIVFSGPHGKRIGIIDPKFTDKRNISQLAQAVYFKYGLFIHKSESANPIDYVWAVYPDFDELSLDQYSARNQGFDSLKPSLGYFSIPVPITESFKNFVKNLVEIEESNIS